jgi:hypothetical protein
MNNEQYVQREIQKKLNSFHPYYPTTQSIFHIKTDMNTFPYQRFFRGQRDSYHPIVWDREAGFSPIIANLDTQNLVSPALETKSTTCFQIPCTTVLPCISNSNSYQPNTRSTVFTSP